MRINRQFIYGLGTAGLGYLGAKKLGEYVDVDVQLTPKGKRLVNNIKMKTERAIDKRLKKMGLRKYSRSEKLMNWSNQKIEQIKQAFNDIHPIEYVRNGTRYISQGLTKGYNNYVRYPIGNISANIASYNRFNKTRNLTLPTPIPSPTPSPTPEYFRTMTRYH